MATQEERLTTLEQNFTTFQRETARRTREIEENTTIMLGVMRSQGQDIRKIFEYMETLDQRLNEHTTRFERIETLLTQILERLPKNP